MGFPTYSIRSYAGGANALTLAGNILSSDLAIEVSGNYTGWPSGSGGPFSVSIDDTLATVEKILCSGFNGGTGVLTVWTDGVLTGRGYDGTTAQGHVPQPQIPQVRPCWTAIEASEANQAVAAGLGAAQTAEAGTIWTADGLGGVAFKSPGGGSAGLFPVGGMLAWPANGTLPTGFLFCNGAAVSRTTYATLFSLFGSAWGSGDGSTTFNLPNMGGKLPAGVGGAFGSGVGITGGTDTMSEAQMPAHTHGVTDPTHAHAGAGGDSFILLAASSTLYLASSGAEPVTFSTLTFPADTLISIQSSGSGNVFLPPFATVNWIIRAL